MEPIENPWKTVCLNLRQGEGKPSNFKQFTKSSYKFSTSFQLGLWKLCLLILPFLTLCSCAHLWTGRETKAAEEVLIGQSEQEVRRRLGEPNVIAKSKDGTILWIYIPSFKVIPDGRGEVFVEFEEGRVKRVVKK